jgi:hypothetical protein
MRFATTNTSSLSVPRSIVLLVDKELQKKYLTYGDVVNNYEYDLGYILIDWCVGRFGTARRFEFADLCFYCIDRTSMRLRTTSGVFFFTFVQGTFRASHLRRPTRILFVSKRTMDLFDNVKTKRVRLVFDNSKWRVNAFDKAA